MTCIASLPLYARPRPSADSLAYPLAGPQADETEADMDVDEPEDGTQQPLKPRDYGLVIDFSNLAEEDQEVRT